MVEKRVVNLWDKDHCVSPCKDNGPCPHNSKCMDLRGELAPEWKCVCQMGMEMVGGRWVRTEEDSCDLICPIINVFHC